MSDIRSELAREWAKKHNIQLSLFDREYSEKDKEDLDEKEFKEMCKKAKVEPGSLAKTVFTRSIESS